MMEKMQTIVFMVRHGQTDLNYSQDKAIDSQRQLTELGQQQSRLVGRFLDQFSPTVIYSSPLDRCQETAKIIQSAITPPPSIKTTDKLVEVYSSSSEVRRVVGERGETIFATILREHRGEQVVAVTHQYIIGYIVAEFSGVPYHSIQCDPADIYRLVFAGDSLVEATRLQPLGVEENLEPRIENQRSRF